MLKRISLSIIIFLIMVGPGIGKTELNPVNTPPYYRIATVGDPGYVTFAAAIAKLNSLGSNRTLIVRDGTHAVSASLSVNSNINLVLMRGADIQVATTKTLTINGTLEAGLYKIFSCTGTGKVVYKGRKYPEWWGAKDDSGTTDNTAAITAALANGGVTKFEAPNGGYYKVTAAVPVPVAATRVISDSKAEIRQATAATKMFSVSVSDVKFRGMKLKGVDSTEPGDTWAAGAAIHTTGTLAAPLTGLEVDNCEISNYCTGIRCPHTSTKVMNNYIHDVLTGVFGGAVLWTDTAEENSNNVVEYEIINNRIICTFGALTASRPINIPLFTGRYVISGNLLRGGGFALENWTDDSSVSNFQNYRITDNDCDTTLSTSNGGVIANNMIDSANSPAGRGPQPTTLGIELGQRGRNIVVGNIIKNFQMAFYMSGRDDTIIGNQIVSCGDQGAGAAGGVITFDQTYYTADTVLNTVIANNVFSGTLGDTTEININGGGAYVVSGVIVSNNVSRDAAGKFFKGNNIQNGEVSGNFIYNACTALTGTSAFGMHSQSSGPASSVTYLNNIFVNAVTAPNGMYQGIAPQAGDTIGFNKFVGMRHTTIPIEPSNIYGVLSPQIMDTGWYDNQPTHADNTAALAGGLTAGARYRTSTGVQMVVY